MDKYGGGTPPTLPSRPSVCMNTPAPMPGAPWPCPPQGPPPRPGRRGHACHEQGDAGGEGRQGPRRGGRQGRQRQPRPAGWHRPLPGRLPRGPGQPGNPVNPGSERLPSVTLLSLRLCVGDKSGVGLLAFAVKKSRKTQKRSMGCAGSPSTHTHFRPTTQGLEDLVWWFGPRGES